MTRPAGEIRRALQVAAQRLVSEGRGYAAADGRQGVTWPQLVEQARAVVHEPVRWRVARRTVVNLASAGEFERIGAVNVPGVCRPMTLFAPRQASAGEPAAARALDAVLRGWRG